MKKDLIGVGYAITKFTGDGRVVGFYEVARNEKGEIEGLTGFGKIYGWKKECEKDVKKVNKVLKTKMYHCVPARITMEVKE